MSTSDNAVTTIVQATQTGVHDAGRPASCADARTIVSANRGPGTWLQWGTRITTPTGATVYEPSLSRANAMLEVRGVNRTGPGRALLVYREVTDGPWTDGPTGDEFGVRYTWADGGSEIHPTPSRHEAECRARNDNGVRGTKRFATVVSQTRTHTDWLPAEPAQPERDQPARPASADCGTAATPPIVAG